MNIKNQCRKRRKLESQFNSLRPNMTTHKTRWTNDQSNFLYAYKIFLSKDIILLKLFFERSENFSVELKSMTNFLQDEALSFVCMSEVFGRPPGDYIRKRRHAL